MRYSREHAGEVRRRLVAEGGRHVKERGVHGAGVDGIARDVGLTGAALYSHFESKRDFLCAILREELGASARRFLSTGASLEELLAGYLSLAHVRAPAAGCALPAITSDIARSDPAVREAFEDGFAELVRALGERLGSREEALGVVAAAVGAVALARALPEDASAREVLESAGKLISSATRAAAQRRRATRR